MSERVRRVAHLKTPYCGLTEGFIHAYVTHMRRYSPFVLTCQTMDLDQFPTPEVYARPGPTRLDYLTMRLTIPLLNRQWPFERFWRSVLQRERPDVVHAHFGPSGIYLLPLRRHIRAPIVTSFYGFDLSSLPRNRWFRGVFRSRRLFRELDHFVVEGTVARRTLIELGCPEEKVSVVHIGVDLARLPFVERTLGDGEPLRLLFCGRFIEKKGLEYAIRAAANVRRGGVALEFRIVGYGPLEGQARALVRELGLSDCVSFVGPLGHEDFHKELLRSHLLIAPSVTDSTTGETEGGAPTVLIEAQATGMPVVASRHADIPDIVRDGESGILAAEGDVDGLTVALLRLAKHPELWPAFGRHGREHVEGNHDIVTEAARLETIYDRCLETNRFGWPGDRDRGAVGARVLACRRVGDEHDT